MKDFTTVYLCEDEAGQYFIIDEFLNCIDFDFYDRFNESESKKLRDAIVEKNFEEVKKFFEAHEHVDFFGNDDIVINLTTDQFNALKVIGEANIA